MSFLSALLITSFLLFFVSFSYFLLLFLLTVFYFPLCLPPDASSLLPQRRVPDGECQGKTGLRMHSYHNTHTHRSTFIHTENRPRHWQRTFCSTLTSYSDAGGSALCPLYTHTHTQLYSIIKPVSQPHRKQSPLYVTAMSLILAEVNKCTCVEGIFHRQDSRQWGHCGVEPQRRALN